MATIDCSTRDNPKGNLSKWDALADRVLEGEHLYEAEALTILQTPDSELLALLAAAFRVRYKYFGRTVQLYFLMNAKSGLCPEDCSYCSQSKDSTADIPKYNLLDEAKLLDGAKEAYQRRCKTYCIVISARGPTEREIAAVTTIVPKIKQAYDIKICACLGLLSPQQAIQLKQAGVDRVNHNLNTGEEFYHEVCSTHTYQDRVDTLKAVKDAGMEMCSGGIVGMGEQPIHLARMAIALRDLGVHSIPVNFLNAIDGTPLEGTWKIDPRYCLKALAMFRLVNPEKEIRIAGGREIHLGSLQPLGLYPANSIFVGDYLTTKGQLPQSDYQMIEDMGFEVTRDEEPACEVTG